MKLSHKLVMVSAAVLMGVSPVLGMAENSVSVQAAPIAHAKGVHNTYGKNSRVKLTKTTKFVDRFGKKTSKSVKKSAKKSAKKVAKTTKKTTKKAKKEVKKATKTTKKEAKKTTKKASNKVAKKSNSKKTIKTVKITMKRRAYVYDKNGKRVKNYEGTHYVGKGITVKGLGTKTIKGVKYYALQPNHYYVKASDVTVK